jgi:hypothetical protein
MDQRREYAIQLLPIAMVFTNINHHDLPFSKLLQLAATGIRDVYFVLTDDEYRLANDDSFQLFDGSKPKNIFKHLQDSGDENLRLHFINSGNLTTDEEKFKFYAEHEKHYQMNICQSDNPEICIYQSQSSIPITIETKRSITNQYFSLFNLEFNDKVKDLGHADIDFMTEQNSTKALEFLYRSSNPCFIQRTGKFDIMCFQWLYKAALLLLKTELAKDHLVGMEDDTIAIKLIDDYRSLARKLSESTDYLMENINMRDCDLYPVGSMLDDLKHYSQIEYAEAEIPKIINQMLFHYFELKNKRDLSFQLL